MLPKNMESYDVNLYMRAVAATGLLKRQSTPREYAERPVGDAYRIVEEYSALKKINSGISRLNKKIAELQQIHTELISEDITEKSVHEKSVADFVLTLDEDNTFDIDENIITPQYLATYVLPYLQAVIELQHIIDELKGNESLEVRIRSIRQNSPISISLEGAIDAVEIVRDSVVPWRRRHAELMAKLNEAEKEIQLEITKAEMTEVKVRAKKGREEAKKISAEAAKIYHEAEKLAIENEKLRLELQREKIKLALDVIEQISPNLSEVDRMACFVRLIPNLDVLVSSNLSISSKG